MRKTLHITLLFLMMLFTGAANAETVTFDATSTKVAFLTITRLAQTK